MQEISEEERAAIVIAIAERAELDSVRGTVNSFMRHELVSLFAGRGLTIADAIEEARRWKVTVKFDLVERD